MEEVKSGAWRREEGTALVVVLLAIVILLPPTLVLSALAIRWQRQSIDYRDAVSEEFVAEAGFEEARARLSAEGVGMAANESTSFEVDELEGMVARVRVSRTEDVVVTLDGGLLEGIDRGRVDLERTGVDAEGRVVHQYRKLEIYVVEVDVSRRQTLPAVKLHGVLARLPGGELETLGLTLQRIFASP